MEPITLKTLPEKSSQEVFDWIVSNLLKQAEKSMNHNSVSCQYRDKFGRKCAAGWVIGDDEYDPKIEGCVWPTSISPRYHVHLIAKLQEVHDRIAPDEWPEAFRVVAQDFKLQFKF